MELQPGRLEQTIELAAAMIAKRSLLSMRYLKPQPAYILACGETRCSKTITILNDGSQQRGRRSEALVTLKTKQTSNLIVTPCDTHGGSSFPSSEAINTALGYQNVGHHEAQQLVTRAGYDTCSDSRSYQDIAQSLDLVPRTDVDMSLLVTD